MGEPRRQIVPPHDEFAERALLSALMVDGTEALDVLGRLAQDDFFTPAYGEMFAAMQALFARGEAIDEVTVVAELKRRGRITEAGGVTGVCAVTESYATAANADHHARLVQQASTGRKLLRLSMQTMQRLTRGEYGDDVIGEHAAAALELASTRRAKSPVPAKALMREALKALELRHQNRGQPVGMPTGHVDLDTRLGGLRRGSLVVVAGRPAMGKSAFAGSVAQRVAMREAAVLVFSLEMTSGEVADRSIAGEARISTHVLSRGLFENADWARLHQSMNAIAASRLWVDDSSGMTLTELRAKARMHKLRHGVDLLVVDYMQLLRLGRRVESREREIAEISAALKEMAKELDCPVVALSQLNRGVESRPDKRPKLSDLRESGSIEQDADVVLSIYRDEVYEPTTADAGIAEIGVLKNRHGPTGEAVKLKWEGDYLTFRDLARWEGPR